MQNVSAGSGRVQRRSYDPGLPVAGIPQSHPRTRAELEQHPPIAVWCRGRKFKGQFERALCEVGQFGRAECREWVNHTICGSWNT